MLSDELIEKDQKRIAFEVSYEVLEEMKTYIAFSLTDIDRNIWVYNDNSLDHMTTGLGKKTLRYTCNLNEMNGCKLRLGVSVRNESDQPFAFSDKENSPIIIISPKKEMSKSERISSSGLVRRNGSWEEIEI